MNLTTQQIQDEYGVSAADAITCKNWIDMHAEILARHPDSWWERECGKPMPEIRRNIFVRGLSEMIRDVWRMPVEVPQ